MATNPFDRSGPGPWRWLWALALALVLWQAAPNPAAAAGPGATAPAAPAPLAVHRPLPAGCLANFFTFVRATLSSRARMLQIATVGVTLGLFIMMRK